VYYEIRRDFTTFINTRRVLEAEYKVLRGIVKSRGRGGVEGRAPKTDKIRGRDHSLNRSEI
jgi:hypothetical protein